MRVADNSKNRMWAVIDNITDVMGAGERRADIKRSKND
jgi:hypothetical protein